MMGDLQKKKVFISCREGKCVNLYNLCVITHFQSVIEKEFLFIVKCLDAYFFELFVLDSSALLDNICFDVLIFEQLHP